ncbi:MAG: response regulator [Candidatus Marinimicrobia bacterium]|nr:response regulator [Candidatus Neomarinimicrobiota bacterium]
MEIKPEDVKVLIIDDEKLILDQLKFFLSEKGYNVEVTDDSKVAMSMIEEKNFDIILTDLVMPHFTGMDIVKKLKDLNKDSQVIIITGFATTDSAIEAIKYGVYDYIRKPFNLKELLVVLNRAAEKLYLSRENSALTNKMKEMLYTVTTLYEVCSILYQVDNVDFAKGIIIDTITEGLKIKKMALLLKKGDRFVVDSSHGISDKFGKNFYFSLGEEINGKKINGEEIIVLDKLNKEIKVGSRSLDIKEDYGLSFVVPIKYMDEVYGFLCVFDLPSDGVFSIEDYIKLWSIISIQIAPAIGMICGGIKTESNYESVVQKLIRDKLREAQNLNEGVTFSLVRLIPIVDFDETKDINAVLSDVESEIKNKFGSDIEVLNDGIDTLIVAIPRLHPIDIEKGYEEIRKRIKDKYFNQVKKSYIALAYGFANYPEDGEKFGDIFISLKENLFKSIIS